MSNQTIQMGIGLSVIPYIGPDLYSNIPAVLSEIVANAWDAGSTIVQIRIDIPKDSIVVEDNGRGMSFSELNDKYLRIGFKKRASEPTSFLVNGQERHVMGRKGIGKLAPFALASRLEIQTTDGNEYSGCLVEWELLKHAIDNDETIFKPKVVQSRDITFSTGTRLVLREINSDKIESLQDVPNIRKQLARRFTVINPNCNFEVRINDIPISDLDRPYIDKVEFVWRIDNSNASVTPHFSNLRHSPQSIANSIPIAGKSYQLSGWVGTVERPSDIVSDGSNTIAIYTHGKLAQEDILAELGESQNFARYVIGNIEADFMDFTNEVDIVTPDRQRLNQNDPRYTALKKYVKEIALSAISKHWSLWRIERDFGNILAVPKIQGWYDGLSNTKKLSAARLFRRISQMVDIDNAAKDRLADIVADNFEAITKQPNLTSLSDNAFQDRLGGFKPSALEMNAEEIVSVSDDITNEEKFVANIGQTEPERTSVGRLDSTDDTHVNTPLAHQSDGESDMVYPEGMRPQDKKAPKYQSDTIFTAITKLIEGMQIEDKLKIIAKTDLREAQIAFNNQAPKACIVMLGAVLEAVMLATLRREEILLSFSQMTPAEIPKPLLNIGILRQPLDVGVLRDDLTNRADFGFEQYRQVIEKLIPDIERPVAVKIQQFRNCVHPSKALMEPSTYADLDLSRAMHYLTALDKILSQVAKWKP